MRHIEASVAVIRSAIGTRDGVNSVSLGKRASLTDDGVQAMKEALLATEGRVRREIEVLRQELERQRHRARQPQLCQTCRCPIDGVVLANDISPRNSGVHAESDDDASSTSGGPLEQRLGPQQVDEASVTSPSPRSGSPVRTSLMSAKPAPWLEWPANVKIRQEVLADDSQHIATMRSLAEYHHSHKNSNTSNFGLVADTDVRGCRLSCVRPDSAKRLFFDMLGILALTFQLTYMPFAFAWPAAVKKVDPIIIATNMVFWSLDTCFNFVTGFYTKAGTVEMRFHKIVRHYLKTWFISDVICLLADVVNAFPVLFGVDVITDDAGPASRWVRMLKLNRFARVLLMFRMLRIAPEVSTMLQIHFSTTVGMLIQITALLLWLSHLVACSWYALGRWASPGRVGVRWLDMWEPIPSSISPSGEEIPGKGPSEVGTTYQYATSFHWALAQITLGAHDVTPVNSSERLVAILCNLFGLLFAGTLVSVLSAAMIEVREADWVRATSLRKLRRFLLQHQVAIDIRMQVLRQVKDRLRPQERTLAEKDAAALTVLSKPLLRQLRYVLYYEHLRDHPLLQAWGVLAEASVKHLCREDISFEILPPDEELFVMGVNSRAARYVVKGNITYHQDATGGLVSENVTETVMQGAWLSEATWWCHWQHVGTASCVTSTTLITVPPSSIAAVMKFDLQVRTVTVEYGTRFHQHVVSSTEGFATDLEVKHGVKGLLSLLPRDVHVLLGMSALRQVNERQELRQRQGKLFESGYIETLENEVQNGHSLVLLNSRGRLHRQVALTVARLENCIGELLVELVYCEQSSSVWKPVVALPAIKQKSQEEPADSLQRLFKTQIQPLAGCFHGAQVEFISEMKDSQRFGIATNYIKTCFMTESSKELDETLRQYIIAPNLHNPTANGVWSSAWCQKRSRFMQVWSRVDEVFHLQGTERSGIYVWMSPEDMAVLAKNKTLLLELLKHELPSIGSTRLEPLDEDVQGEQEEDAHQISPSLQEKNGDKDMETEKEKEVEEDSEDEDVDQI